jgi:hypothetical protein
VTFEGSFNMTLNVDFRMDFYKNYDVNFEMMDETKLRRRCMWSAGTVAAPAQRGWSPVAIEFKRSGCSSTGERM